MLLAPLRARLSPGLLVLGAQQPASPDLPSALVPESRILHDLLLFDTCNEPGRKKRGDKDVLRRVGERRCCVLPVLQWSSFSVVLFRTISSSLFFLQFTFSTYCFETFSKTLTAFISVEEKMGNPARRQHMNGKLAAFIFLFFF